MPVTINPTNIVFNDGTTQSTAASSSGGTVTSVATGNGLQGGTITTTGTLSVACPTHNTVGSYVFAGRQYNVSDFSMTFGTNYAGGNGYDSICGVSCRVDSLAYWGVMNLGSSLSGTWKWMAGNTGTIGGPNGVFGLACRVS